MYASKLRNHWNRSNRARKHDYNLGENLGLCNENSFTIFKFNVITFDIVQ